MEKKKEVLIGAAAFAFEGFLLILGYFVLSTIFIGVVAVIIWKLMGRNTAVIFSSGLISLLVTFYLNQPLFMAIFPIVSAFQGIFELHNRSEKIKLAEELFLMNFGQNPEKVELISRPPAQYECHQHGIHDKAVQVKFFSQNRAVKGLVDLKNEKLHVKEYVLFPVYRGEDIPLWKEVINTHRNGMPKKVEFYDDAEILHKVDYLDEQGNLVKESWRRYHEVVEFWDPKKDQWEPVL